MNNKEFCTTNMVEFIALFACIGVVAYFMYSYVQQTKSANAVITYVHQASQKTDTIFVPENVWIDGNEVAVNKRNEIVATTTSQRICKTVAEALVPNGKVVDSCSVKNGSLIFNRNN